ncbi:MAG: hypothetical protein QM754_03655 [Tepidisphaeraceae bacterium]
MMVITQFENLLKLLSEGGVRFIIVGGIAGRARGASRVTDDLDLVYDRADDNIAKLVRTLKPIAPYPRGAPPGLPFFFDERQIKSGLNFTFVTSLGWLDLLGEATGGGTYDQLIGHSTPLEIFGHHVQCVTLEMLIRLKRAAGRPKDFEAIAELESLRLRSKDI